MGLAEGDRPCLRCGDAPARYCVPCLSDLAPEPEWAQDIVAFLREEMSACKQRGDGREFETFDDRGRYRVLKSLMERAPATNTLASSEDQP